jgi:hypothetical protein
MSQNITILYKKTFVVQNRVHSISTSRYTNNSSTAIVHPGTAGSASAISPRRKITGFSGEFGRMPGLLYPLALRYDE